MSKTISYSKKAYAIRASINDAISFASQSYHVDLFKYNIPDATEYIHVFRTDGIKGIGMTVIDSIYNICKQNRIHGNVEIINNRLTVVIAL